MFYDTEYLLNNNKFMKCVDEHIYTWIDDYMSGKVKTLPKKVIPHENPIIFCEEDFLLEKLQKHKNPSLYWNTSDAGPVADLKDVMLWYDIEFHCR